MLQETILYFKDLFNSSYIWVFSGSKSNFNFNTNMCFFSILISLHVQEEQGIFIYSTIWLKKKGDEWESLNFC